MDEPDIRVIEFEEGGQPKCRGGPLGRRWKLLASVNLFIMSLKSKWRRNRRGKLRSGDTGAGTIYEANPRILVNNWTSQPSPCPSSRSPSPPPFPHSTAVPNSGINFGGNSRPSTAGSLRLKSRRLTSFVGITNVGGRRMSVRNVWQNLTKGRSDSPERRPSTLGVIDPKESHHWPTSVTRQLAFGPWENAASRSKLHSYLMKVPFAKLITLIVFLICVIVVTVIYVKEAEVEEKLKKKYGWS